MAGEFLMPALSAASTYALGQVVTNHFAKGGSLEDFDLKWAKKQYDEELQKGKQVAKEATAKTESQDDIVSKLKKLNELKEAGILSEEEFAQMKGKLLAQM
jgi:Short C-terminal domain